MVGHRQECREVGRTVPSLDGLVAAVVLHYNAALVSLDSEVDAITGVRELRLKRLERPS